MNITFNVTQEDIDRGLKYDASMCMAAMCIKRTLAWDVITTNILYSTIYLKKLCYKFNHKVELQKNITTFDANRKINPFSFSLDIPDEILEQIGYFDIKGDTFVDDYVKVKQTRIKDDYAEKEPSKV